MSQRFLTLAARRTDILRRCEHQREQARQYAQTLLTPVGSVDRGLILLRRLVSTPATLVGGAALLAVLGRNRALRLLGSGLTLLATTRGARSMSAQLARIVGQLVNRSR